MKTVNGPPTPGRVLQLVLSLEPGGAERLVIETAHRLTQHIPMAVCSLDGTGAWDHELTDRGIPLTTLDRRPGFRPAIARMVAREARRHRATVLHCHQYSPFVYGSLSIAFHGAKVVYTEHGRLADSCPGLRRRVANTVIGRLPRRIVAVSEDLRRSMIAEGFPGDRIEVVRNGIDPGAPADDRARRGARQRLGLPADAVVIGTVARLDRVKDLRTLVEAFSALRRALPTAVLLIVGEGPLRTELEAVAAHVAAGEAVRFLGMRADARNVIAAFDVYVNTSISEGISLSILEAMAAGLPVVATRVGGTPEVVQDSVTGILVAPRDPSALAHVLAQLAVDTSRRAAMGAAGRARVEDQFALDSMVHRYRTMYEELSR